MSTFGDEKSRSGVDTERISFGLVSSIAGLLYTMLRLMLLVALTIGKNIYQTTM